MLDNLSAKGSKLVSAKSINGVSIMNQWLQNNYYGLTIEFGKTEATTVKYCKIDGLWRNYCKIPRHT